MASRVAARWAGWLRSAPRNLAGPLAGASAPQLTLTLNTTLSRVEIYATSLGSAATYAVIERSLDGVRWSTVRGAAELTLLGQSLPATHYDYEFLLGTVTYRVRSYNALGGVEITVTETVATSLDAVHLKSPVRPFLNLTVSLGGPGFEAERDGRGTASSVMDRSLPVAVSQLSGSKRYPLLIRTSTDLEARNLDYLLASGDVLFLHAPADMVVPAGGVYLLVDQAGEKLLHVAGERRHWAVPVQEVAAPGPDVGYALLTWQTILDSYGTLDALLTANRTLDDLLALLAEPSEVIVE